MGKISLVIAREYKERVRKRTFIITTLLMPLLMVAMMVIPALIAIFSGSDQKAIVVFDQSREILEKLENNQSVHFISSSTPYPEMVAQVPNASGYLVIPSDIIENQSTPHLYMNGATSYELEQQIIRNIESVIEQKRVEQSNIPKLDSIINSIHANIQIRTFTLGDQSQGVSQKESNSAVSMAVAYISGFMIYMFVLIYGAMVMQGVIEEKSSRIIEVMVSSVKPFELMMGKILGIAFVALTQVAIWGVLIATGMGIISGILPQEIATGGMQEAAALPSELSGALAMIGDPWYLISIAGCFILYFIGGYLLYASMYAAVGSSVDNSADAQQLQMPVTIPLVISLFIMMSVMKDPTGGLAFWCSMIPFTSPIVMMARISYGVPLWEVITSLVILYGTFVAMTWVAAKIYRVGIFMYGKKPSLMEIIRWSRYKG
ncbi:MAG: ABC transporter permease [Rikenellaceae bacterium]